MTEGRRPDDAGRAGREETQRPAFKDDELERRRRELDAALASRSRQQEAESRRAASPGSAAGFATALKLSSEFIAGILVGTAIGWLIDKLAGTSPWGMIIFLLLGFGAGVLNVLRSAGLVAERSLRSNGAETPPDE
ncbi:MAG: AtpZ/AtpI family protein [Rhizobiaceae bacterium]